MFDPLKQLYQYRALVQILILRELKARYRGTALGFLWSFVNPLLLMTIYVLVFSVYLRMDMKNYPVFLLSGILPWAWFSSGIIESTGAIVGNGGLIRKVYLPSEIFPLVSIGSNMIHFLLSVPVLLLFLIFSGVPLSWWLLLLPVVMAIQLVFTYSLALLVSSLTVQFRDLLHIVSNLMLAWFFLTPVFYPITAVPLDYRALVDLNPMAHLILAYQRIFFYHQAPSALSLLVLAGVSCVLLAVGFMFFETRKDLFAEEV